MSAEEIEEHHQGTFSDETGLVGLWHMDEGSGDTVGDSSGQANHGTRYGATWVDSGIPAVGRDLAQIKGVVNVQDSGVGIDIISAILAKLLIQDSGVGADLISAIKAKLSIADSGSGVEAITVEAITVEAIKHILLSKHFPSKYIRFK